MTRFRTIGLLALFLLIALILGRVLVSSYLNGDGFRKKISEAVSQKLKADGSFMPLHLVGGTFFSDGFRARGNSGTFFSQMQADQVRASFNWRALFQRTVEVDELNIEKLDVHFAERSAHDSTTEKSERESARASGSWKLDLRQARIGESSWHWGADPRSAGGITGSAFKLTPNGPTAWLIDASSGKISQTGWPDLLIESARLRYTPSALFVNDSVLRTGTGRIAVSGEVNFHKDANLQAQFEDLPIAPLLTPDWRVKLNGRLTGSSRVLAPLTGGPIHVEGNVHLVDGQLETLPILDQIAKFTRTDRFRRMSLSKASLSFTRDSKLTTAKDVVLESEGLMRVEGAFTVMDEQIEGIFQVGVTAASLQWLPGSQARVFTISHDGYYWTPVHVTGPVGHPTEDLTPRLVAAAANELLQNSEDAVRETAKSLLDLVPH
jgi:hypothetical protein